MERGVLTHWLRAGYCMMPCSDKLNIRAHRSEGLDRDVTTPSHLGTNRHDVTGATRAESGRVLPEHAAFGSRYSTRAAPQGAVPTLCEPERDVGDGWRGMV